jgi:hypothetical protein
MHHLKPGSHHTRQAQVQDDAAAGLHTRVGTWPLGKCTSHAAWPYTPGRAHTRRGGWRGPHQGRLMPGRTWTARAGGSPLPAQYTSQATLGVKGPGWQLPPPCVVVLQAAAQSEGANEHPLS